jgi:uncharacterized membrane protein YraQ (UPF0718 family)
MPGSIWMLGQRFLTRSALLMQVFWQQLRLFTPWWVAGIAAGAMVAQLAPRVRWPAHRWLNGPLGSFLGALLGILSPLPLFGAIGLAASLAATGVSAVPLVAFLFASPLLNPNLFVFTGLSLGWNWALLRAAGALFLGTMAGLLTLLFSGRGKRSGWLQIRTSTAVSPFPDPQATEALSVWSFLRKALAEAQRVLGFSWRYFLLALILSAWVVAFLPRAWVTAGFGQGRWWGVPAAVLLGVPGYFCGGGAVPLVHGLLAQGMSQGAALAFLLSGPATTPRNLAALGTITGWRGLVFFLVLTQGGAIVLGFLFDLVG